MVYSAAKQNQTLGLEWARNPEVGLPKPDLVVFLDLEPEVQQKRAGWGEERYEEKDMQKRVREGFLALLEREEGKVMKAVNAGMTIDKVEQELWAVVKGVVEEVGEGKRGVKVGVVEPW